MPILIHPNDSNTVYVLDRKNGVYKTTNGGTDLTPINANLPSIASIGCYNHGDLEMDPKNPSVLYLSMDQNGVYRLKDTDSNTSWEKMTSISSTGTLGVYNGGPMVFDSRGNFIDMGLDYSYATKGHILIVGTGAYVKGGDTN